MTSTEKTTVSQPLENPVVSAPAAAKTEPLAAPSLAPAATTAVAAPAAAKKVAARIGRKPAAKKPVALTPVALKPALKTPLKTRSKAVVKIAVKAPAKAKAKAIPQAKIEKVSKLKKPKLVRDSFTIPKAEYTVLDELKQRATQLASPVKKSELIRAGVKALAAMSDSAFLATLKSVPTIKTGRPSKD